MQGIRDYLPDQNTAPLHKAILKVQEQHQSEQPNFSESLTLALYKFRVSCTQCENSGNLLTYFIFRENDIVFSKYFSSENRFFVFPQYVMSMYTTITDLRKFKETRLFPIELKMW